jgi:quercetin dioxygenase-like cupin family protein
MIGIERTAGVGGVTPDRRDSNWHAAGAMSRLQSSVRNQVNREEKMFRALVIGTILGISLTSTIRMANSEDAAPKGNKGFTASKTTVVDLGSEIEGMAGRQLRMRMLTIEPGGYIGIHSHKDRPAVVYFMQGTDEVGQADGSKKTMHPGDTSMATTNTTHYHRNVGKDSVVLIAVDIFHPAK